MVKNSIKIYGGRFGGIGKDTNLISHINYTENTRSFNLNMVSMIIQVKEYKQLFECMETMKYLESSKPNFMMILAWQV